MVAQLRLCGSPLPPDLPRSPITRSPVAINAHVPGSGTDEGELQEIIVDRECSVEASANRKAEIFRVEVRAVKGDQRVSYCRPSRGHSQEM